MGAALFLPFGLGLSGLITWLGMDLNAAIHDKPDDGGGHRLSAHVLVSQHIPRLFNSSSDEMPTHLNISRLDDMVFVSLPSELANLTELEESVVDREGPGTSGGDLPTPAAFPVWQSPTTTITLADPTDTYAFPVPTDQVIPTGIVPVYWYGRL